MALTLSLPLRLVAEVARLWTAQEQIFQSLAIRHGGTYRIGYVKSFVARPK